MPIQLETHENFNAKICGVFAGQLLVEKNEVARRCAALNFNRLYKLLTVEEKKLLRQLVEQVRTNPKKFFQDNAAFASDIANDDDFLDSLKEGLDDGE